MEYPAEISNDKANGTLTIVWRDGVRQQWPHALLRANCKCTQCQSRRLLGVLAPQLASAVAPAVAPDHLRVQALEMVGNYGLQLVFSDGHERGIYPWPYLRAMPDAAA